MVHYNLLSRIRRIMYKALFVFCIILLFLFSSCEKLIEVAAPPTSQTNEIVYSTDATAISLITSLYIKTSEGHGQDAKLKGIPIYTGIASDELALVQGVPDLTLFAYYTNSLTIETVGNGFWENIYPLIYITNSAIEQLPEAQLTNAVKQQLLGEAKFMRAFCYFYLVNLYGDVPLVLSSDYKKNASLSRTAFKDVYKQIVRDLNDAETLLADHYLDGTLLKESTDRIRPTKWAALALLARVYLYTEEYALAEEASSQVINNSSLFSIVSLNDVFLMNSLEAIWQLQPVGLWDPMVNTTEGRLFILPETGPETSNRRYYLNKNLVNSFELQDLRLKNWIDSVKVINDGITTVYYYPYKYKIGYEDMPATEYSMVLRLAEQYLIRAEARTILGNITGANSAESDLNIIRSRAGLNPTTANTETDMLAAISKERRNELFTEWGDRWLNLKRTKMIDDVMVHITPQKGSGEWTPYQALFPISRSELMADPFLIQNPGY